MKWLYRLIYRLLFVHKDMTVDKSKLNIDIPAFDNDRVVLADTQTYSVGAGVIGTFVDFTYNKPFTFPTLPIGIFTYDGGSTYNDVFNVAAPPSGAGPLIVLGAFSVAIFSNNSSLTIRITRWSGAAGTITVSFALLAFADEQILDTLAGTRPLGSQLSLAYSSTGQYRKIALNQQGNYTSSAPVAIAQPTGAIPVLTYWGSSALGWHVPGAWNDPTELRGHGVSIYGDTNNIYLGSNASVFNTIARVYWEN